MEHGLRFVEDVTTPADLGVEVQLAGRRGREILPEPEGLAALLASQEARSVDDGGLVARSP